MLFAHKVIVDVMLKGNAFLRSCFTEHSWVYCTNIVSNSRLASNIHVLLTGTNSSRHKSVLSVIIAIHVKVSTLEKISNTLVLSNPNIESTKLIRIIIRFLRGVALYDDTV